MCKYSEYNNTLTTTLCLFKMSYLQSMLCTTTLRVLGATKLGQD